MSKAIRVLIVEDSAVVRSLLEMIVDSDPRLQVIASCSSGEEALRLIPELRPDVISMDVRLPGLDGLEITRRIMQEYPTPIVVVSSHLDHEELNIGFNALRAGALSVLDKPYGPGHQDADRQARALCTQLVIMSQVKVIRLGNRLNKPTAGTPTPAPARPEPQTSQGLEYEALGIVSSTGGPRALSILLNSLGPDFPIPVFLVQHITPSFTQGFIDWLNTTCPFKAVEATKGEIPEAGKIYLPPANQHLLYRFGKLGLSDTEPVSYQRPSGTVLLKSMAAELGKRAIGAVLTGMGDDGAIGLLQLKQAGGYTLAEAESTAVVYGMPAVAARLNAATQILPIHDMGQHINGVLRGTAKL